MWMISMMKEWPLRWILKAITPSSEYACFDRLVVDRRLCSYSRTVHHQSSHTSRQHIEIHWWTQFETGVQCSWCVMWACWHQASHSSLSTSTRKFVAIKLSTEAWQVTYFLPWQIIVTLSKGLTIPDFIKATHKQQATCRQISKSAASNMIHSATKQTILLILLTVVSLSRAFQTSPMHSTRVETIQLNAWSLPVPESPSLFGKWYQECDAITRTRTYEE